MKAGTQSELRPPARRRPAFSMRGCGVISCDRHSAYKKFARLHPGIVLRFCWSHQRRDLLKLANEHPPLCAWAMRWVGRIGQLFDLYEQRGGTEEHSRAYRKADQQLHSRLRRMARERTRSRRDPECIFRRHQRDQQPTMFNPILGSA